MNLIPFMCDCSSQSHDVSSKPKMAVATAFMHKWYQVPWPLPTIKND